jgi:steroid delta-isomerase-like uncharacterized protein
MKSEQMNELVRRFLDAFVAQDLEACRSMLAGDAVYEEEATQRRVQGADAILAVMSEWKRAYPDLKGTLRESFTGRDALVVEIEWDGTHHGDLPSRFGVIPATGKHGRLPAVQVFRFADGKIRALHHYFDLLTMLGQVGIEPLGIAPPPAAA